MSAEASTIYSDVLRKNREGKTLSELIPEEAGRLGFTAKGNLDGNWSGIQKATGLKFLEQIARETGKIMKAEGKDLVFFPLAQIKASGVSGTIDRADVIDYSLTDKAAGRIRKCTVKCWKKADKLLVTGTYDTGIAGGGSRTEWEDVEDAAAAKERAKNFVEDWNKQGLRFQVTVPGSENYRAGIRISTTGFGIFSKTWYIAEAQHVISRSGGYTTTLTLQV
jgi:hypothetical protein